VNAEEIAQAVSEAGLNPLPSETSGKFAQYLELLLKWNAKLNLTAVRQPEEMVARHFVECIQCAEKLPEVSTLLDFGSGAGFPGVPISLIRREIQVTLGESQAKKASFLREAVRTLGLNAVVYDGRIEEMAPETRFDAVTLRAVDRMADACTAAVERLKPAGWMAVFATESTVEGLRQAAPEIDWVDRISTPGLSGGFLMMGRKTG
jgi:16S rRNA (guanine527-N7)-methyltransferase